MKRLVAAGVLAALGLVGGATAYVGQSKVPPEAIRTSVTRSEDLLEVAWQLPAASAIGRDLQWQSNGSVCGAASLANVLRSLGEEPDTEDEVLEGVSSCRFHICPVGLTLDQKKRGLLVIQ